MHTSGWGSCFFLQIYFSKSVSHAGYAGVLDNVAMMVAVSAPCHGQELRIAEVKKITPEMHAHPIVLQNNFMFSP
jgi:hypothetical protein